MVNSKFMQSLNPDVYKEMTQIAKKRGISLQELLRAIVIPEWLNENGTRRR